MEKNEREVRSWVELIFKVSLDELFPGLEMASVTPVNGFGNLDTAEIAGFRCVFIYVKGCRSFFAKNDVDWFDKRFTVYKSLR